MFLRLYLTMTLALAAGCARGQDPSAQCGAAPYEPCPNEDMACRAPEPVAEARARNLCYKLVLGMESPCQDLDCGDVCDLGDGKVRSCDVVGNCISAIPITDCAPGDAILLLPHGP